MATKRNHPRAKLYTKNKPGKQRDSKHRRTLGEERTWELMRLEQSDKDMMYFFYAAFFTSVYS